MKFTSSQLEFLMTKMTISDIDAFNAEASQFAPTKKPRVVKPVLEKELCKGVKKDGNPCKNKGKEEFNGLCSRHKLIIESDSE